MTFHTRNQIFFVVGPTASGKSAWALREAKNNNGIIVNADSVQVYKYLNIGSAKPNELEQKEVPHFLYDIVEPSIQFTAGDYYRAAMKVIEENIEKNNIYFVGGSGFYLQALEKGMFDVGPIPAEIQNKVAQINSPQELYNHLMKVDEKAAQKIGSSDPYRLSRALSVVWSTGKTMAQIEDEFRAKNLSLSQKYSLIKVGIHCDRKTLRDRVTSRTEKMLQAGLLDEVKNLMAKGFAETKALSSVGYKECIEFLGGGMSMEDLKSKIVTSTMQLAKRQMTWFKRDKEIKWLEL